MSGIIRAAGICAGLLTLSALYVLMKYLITGLSVAFGEGVFVGFILNFALWFGAWWFSPESFQRPPR
jgi:hypothetical protein